MKKLLLALFALAAVLLAVLVGNTARTSRMVDAPAVAPVSVAVDSAGALARLSAAVQLQTVSYEEGTRLPDSAAFRTLHEQLRVGFPLVHAAMPREVVNGLALLYTWPGSDTSLAPVVLMGHLDVVPVVPGTEGRWTHPPFSGDVADGYVWGRGTLDDKVSVLSLLEGAEGALRNGFKPRRTIYFAFGHDEEVGGKGARAIKDLLMKRGIRKPALVVDEGGAILPGAALGATGTIAMVGSAEKGYVSLQLSVQGAGGHSSAPPAHTAIGRLAMAIARLEESPFPMALDGPSLAMLEHLRGAMPYGQRLALSNLWLLKSAVVRGLAAKPSGAAMLRTTTAVTIVSGGVKANVLPPEAKATVNFRIRPGETVASVTEYVRHVIGDTGVVITPIGPTMEPSPVSDWDGKGFAAIEQSLREVLPARPLIVAPFLVMGATDARNWSTVTDQTFRFIAAPFELDALERAHGTNERVTVGAYLTAIRFWDRLLRNTDRL